MSAQELLIGSSMKWVSISRATANNPKIIMRNAKHQLEWCKAHLH
uniref:Uncharacterized protein n=1 Tax=Anguilla anguilla TaxID=7936 RepID=A0A0E9RW80_ANGAN